MFFTNSISSLDGLALFIASINFMNSPYFVLEKHSHQSLLAADTSLD
jgi:hypothetical protein